MFNDPTYLIPGILYTGIRLAFYILLITFLIKAIKFMNNYNKK